MCPEGAGGGIRGRRARDGPGRWLPGTGPQPCTRPDIRTAMTAIEPAGPAAARDPDRPARLLRSEHDALLPILRRTPDPDFDRPTACPGWSVRDVLAQQYPPGTSTGHELTPEPPPPSKRTVSTPSNPSAVPGCRSRDTVLMTPISGTRARPARAAFRASEPARSGGNQYATDPAPQFRAVSISGCHSAGDGFVLSITTSGLRPAPPRTRRSRRCRRFLAFGKWSLRT